MRRDLRGDFHVDRVLPDELRIVLLDHFASASSNPDDENAILYTRDQKGALEVRYSKRGAISGIWPGEAFLESDRVEIRTQIERALMAKGEKKIRRDFYFSRLPVEGAWRFRDQFQILPPPPSAPRPPWPVGDYPFVLEVSFEDSVDMMVAAERAQRKSDDVALMLSAFLPALNGSRLNGEQGWGLVVGSGTTEPRWTQATYGLEGFQHLSDDFSESQAPSLGKIDTGSFYDPLHSVPSGEGKVLDLPESIEELLGCAESLDADRRERFMRWGHWLRTSGLSASASQSLSYLAIIQAVESLLPKTSNPHCENCDQELPPGPTSRFADFLTRYVPLQDGETERERKRLYALRSALAHGRTIFEADQGLRMGAFHPSWITESSASRYASQLARIAGLNWLLAEGA